MKNRGDNICKFVTEGKDLSLVTVNFVYEKNGDILGKVFVKPTHAVYLPVSGSGTLSADGREYPFSAGMLFFTFSGEQTVISGDSGLEYMYISFKGSRASELFERFGISTARRIFSGYEALIPFWQSAIGKADTQNLDLISESVLLYTFSQMSQCSHSSEQYLIGSILSHIESSFSDHSLSLASTAEALGYNPKYISRVFSKNVGITFSEYLMNTRIKNAVFLMEQGVTSIKNVAILSGYSDPLYFSSVFRRIVGMSPSEFLERQKENAE